jgi:hypothetical protein
MAQQKHSAETRRKMSEARKRYLASRPPKAEPSDDTKLMLEEFRKFDERKAKADFASRFRKSEGDIEA